MKMTKEDYIKQNKHAEAYNRFGSLDAEPSEQTMKAIDIDWDFFLCAQRALDVREDHELAQQGEWLRHPTGYTRITHAWDDGVQTGGTEGSSYHIYANGVCSYSGGLDSSVPFKFIQLTNEKKEGVVWTFSRQWSGAHRGVYCRLEFRVFTLMPITRIDWVKDMPSQFNVMEVTEEVYNDALGAVPPIVMDGGFFVMGEAYSHRGAVPVYYCFQRMFKNKFYCTVNTIEDARKAFKEFGANVVNFI